MTPSVWRAEEIEPPPPHQGNNRRDLPKNTMQMSPNESLEAMVARLDERTKTIHAELTTHRAEMKDMLSWRAGLKGQLTLIATLVASVAASGVAWAFQRL